MINNTLTKDNISYKYHNIYEMYVVNVLTKRDMHTTRNISIITGQNSLVMLKIRP